MSPHTHVVTWTGFPSSPSLRSGSRTAGNSHLRLCAEGPHGSSLPQGTPRSYPMIWRWRRSGFRIYVDVQMDHALRISRALIALADDSSSENERGAKNVADKRRRRWRKTSGRQTLLSAASSSVSSTSAGDARESLGFISLGVQGAPPCHC